MNRRVVVFLLILLLLPATPAIAQTLDENADKYTLPTTSYYTEFYKDNDGYDKICKTDGTVLIYSQRYTIEYLTKNQWKQVTVPYYVEADGITVIRQYTDYIGTTAHVIYHQIQGGYKTDVIITSGETRTYRIAWALDGINADEVKTGENYIDFIQGTDTIRVDWNDAAVLYGEIAETEISETANGKKLVVYFYIGEVAKGETYTLDPVLLISATGGATSDFDLEALHPSANASRSAFGQSFTTGVGYNVTLNSIGIQLDKDGAPTGNSYLVIYAHSGVFGTSSVPTGAALATSQAKDISTIVDGGAPVYYNYTFTGANKITLEPGVNYCWALLAPTAGLLNPTNEIDTLKTTASITTGNGFEYFNSAWSTLGATADFRYYLYIDGVVTNLNATGTDIDKDAWGWVNVTVHDTGGVGNLATVDSTILTAGDTNNFTIRWTQATDTFSETSDPDGICTLNGGVSANLNATTVLLSMNITMTGGQSGLCDVSVSSLNDDTVSDVDTFADVFTFTYYSWNSIVYDLINSAFGFWGLADVMASLSAFVNGVTTYFTTSLTSLIQLIQVQFSVILNVFPWFIRWLVRIVNRVVAIGTILVQLFNGTYPGLGTLINIWDLIELSQWTDIIVLVVLGVWVQSVTKRGNGQWDGMLGVALQDIQTMMNITGWFMSMFSTVINIVVDYTFRLFEAIT